MSVTVDLKEKVTKYGHYEVKVIAAGEGFRNSEPVIVPFENLPLLTFEADKLIISNVLDGVRSYDLYADGEIVISELHDEEDSSNIILDLIELKIEAHEFYVSFETSYGIFTSEKILNYVLGVEGMYVENVELTRTDDAKDLSYSINNDTGIVTSDFDNYFPYNEMKEVVSGDNTYISIPAIWFRIGIDENSNITDIAASKYKGKGDNWFKSDAFLVGKYIASKDSGLLKSVTHKTAVCETLISLVSYAKANGSGYKTYGLYEHTILTFLWLIEFANKCSTDIMTGYDGFLSITGDTDEIGAVTGFITNNKRMKYRGIEDFCGNGLMYFSDITANYYVTRDVNYYKDGTANKTQLSYWSKVSSKATQNWKSIRAIGWDSNNPFFCLPTVLGSSGEKTYFKTNFYGPYNSSTFAYRGRNYKSYNTNNSLMTLMCDIGFNSNYSSTGTRLIKY